MMKKLLLLSAAGLVTMGAFAQSSVTKRGNSVLPLVPQSAEKFMPAAAAAPGTSTTTGGKVDPPSGKATAAKGRWYSYIEYMSILDPTIASDSVEFPYLWNQGNAKGIYSDGSGGLVADTISLASYGISFDPAFSIAGSTAPFTLGGFNEPSVFDTSFVAVQRTDAYVIDSVRVFGVYGRNNLKTTSVDTMRIAVVYGGAASGSDLPIYYFGGTHSTFPYTAFGYDTVRFAGLMHDTARNIAAGATRVIKDIYLTKTDTSTSAIKIFQREVGMTVPAGNIVGVTATFISGETYTKYVDTVFFGSLRTSNPFNFGMVRPRFFAETLTPGSLSAPAYPRYWPGYYNTGFVKNLPDNSSWKGMYVPSYAYTAPFSLENPDIDVKVSCATCKSIGQLRIASVQTFLAEPLKAFPNPAYAELNVPFTLTQKADVTVRISNMLGQTIATQTFANVGAGQKTTATFNIGDLSSGLYMYTVEANGQHASDRFSVAH